MSHAYFGVQSLQPQPTLGYVKPGEVISRFCGKDLHGGGASRASMGLLGVPRTSNVPKMMAPYSKIESIGSVGIGSIVFGSFWEVQVNGSTVSVKTVECSPHICGRPYSFRIYARSCVGAPETPARTHSEDRIQADISIDIMLRHI